MKKTLFVAALAALLCSCGGSETKLTKGSLSTMDTLSYAMGVNIAASFDYQMGDIPFDVTAIEKGMKEGAFEKASLTHEEAVEQLRDYFMNKRQARAQQIAADRAQQDSIRLAQGDSTKVEYPRADQAMFESEEEREELSYALGVDLGSNMRQAPYALQLVWVCKGLTEGMSKSATMSAEESNQFLQHYFMVTVPEQNKVASEKWLAQIEKKSGVQKTESGLLYKVVKMGDETKKATSDSDRVTVHYTGRTREGKVFDTSIFANRPKEQQKMILEQNPAMAEADEPITFNLDQVIAGWTEGMKLVGVGGTIKLWIPSELAYGPRGAGGDIGPNEALEFEVELLDVTPSNLPTTEEPAAEE